MRVTLIALALAANASSQQLVFEPAAPLEGFAGAGNGLVAADLNGDGRDDLVDSLIFTGQLTVGINAGDGTFVTAPLEGRTRPFRLADVDGDNALDIVHSTAAMPQVISWSRGLGDGTFEDAVSILPAGGSSPSLDSIAVGDVNGDGHVDVAYVDGLLSARRTVLLGQGDGTFVSTPELAGSLFSTVQLGDVDGDGLSDLVASGVSGPQWLRSLGDGSFDAPLDAPRGLTVNLLGNTAVEFVEVETSDVSTDIVVRTWVEGVFEDLVRISSPITLGSPDVSPTDADGDGLLDLVMLTNYYGLVFRQQAGDFALAASFTTPDDVNKNATAVTTTAGEPRDLAVRSTFGGVSMARNVTYGADTSFSDLGGSTPGSVGFPTQVLAADGADLSVRVLSAAPSAPIFAVWGASLGMALGDSAISPSPDRVIGPVMTSPDGTLTTAAVDALPIGLEIYAQWWIADPSTESGFSSTSTVKIDNR